MWRDLGIDRLVQSSGRRLRRVAFLACIYFTLNPRTYSAGLSLPPNATLPPHQGSLCRPGNLHEESASLFLIPIRYLSRLLGLCICIG